MKDSHGFIFGLVLFCATRVLLSGKDAETYSMNEIVEKGVPPKLIKRVEPLVLFINGSFMGISHEAMPGTVTVDFIIDDRGRVKNSQVVRYSNPDLVQPALEAIRVWKYEPAKINGEPVSVATTEKLGTGEPINGPNVLSWRGGMRIVAMDRQALPQELQWQNVLAVRSAAHPVYPRSALRSRKEGSAKIKLIVAPDGQVAAAQVQNATTPEMGQAACAAIETWEFTPPVKNDGTPCSALLLADIDFRFFGWEGRMVSQETRKALRLLQKDAGKIVTPEKLDRPLKPVLTRAPVYPVAMRDKGETGQAEVDVLIDTNGEVQLPTVASSTTPEFGYAAVQAVATWRFDVPRIDGKPVVTRARIPVLFRPPAVTTPN